MSRIRFVTLFSVLALAFGASALSASTIAYAVGKCRPDLRSFHTISRALAAVPSANVVEVCPGTYREQVQVTHPVTLEGVSTGNSAQAIIAPLAGGLVTNATTDFGFPVAAQLWVNNASGPVNIINLAVDASGNGISTTLPFVVGIFYQNTNGTMNHIVTRNQSGGGAGVGIWAEGGSSNPLVTMENSSVHDYDFEGILVETNSATPELTAMIRENKVATSSPFAGGIVIGPPIPTQGAGSAVTITSNLVVTGGIGVEFGSTGSISANTLVNGGIFIGADGVSATSNKIFGSSTGIFLDSSVAAIQRNSITNSLIGIDFHCNANPNVHSNIITEAGLALGNVPSGTATSNTYFNVGTIRIGVC